MRRWREAWIVLAALSGCSTPNQQTPAPVGDNSRNSLDWQGAYVGTVPCADCEGIHTRIELRRDGTFSRSLTYLGKNEPPLNDTGPFTWDTSGSRIALGATASGRRENARAGGE